MLLVNTSMNTNTLILHTENEIVPTAFWKPKEIKEQQLKSRGKIQENLVLSVGAEDVQILPNRRGGVGVWGDLWLFFGLCVYVCSGG